MYRCWIYRKSSASC